MASSSWAPSLNPGASDEATPTNAELDELASEEDGAAVQPDSDDEEEDDYVEDEEEEEEAVNESFRTDEDEDEIAFATARSLADLFNFETAYEEEQEAEEGDDEEKALVSSLPTFAQLAREVMHGQEKGFGEGTDEERLGRLFANLKRAFKNAQHLDNDSFIPFLYNLMANRTTPFADHLVSEVSSKTHHTLSAYLREFLMPRILAQREYEEYGKVKNLSASGQGSSGARVDIFEAQRANLAIGSPWQLITVRYAGCSTRSAAIRDREDAYGARTGTLTTRLARIYQANARYQGDEQARPVVMTLAICASIEEMYQTEYVITRIGGIQHLLNARHGGKARDSLKNALALWLLDSSLCNINAGIEASEACQAIVLHPMADSLVVDQVSERLHSWMAQMGDDIDFRMEDIFKPPSAGVTVDKEERTSRFTLQHARITALFSEAGPKKVVLIIGPNQLGVLLHWALHSGATGLDGTYHELTLNSAGEIISRTRSLADVCGTAWVPDMHGRTVVTCFRLGAQEHVYFYAPNLTWLVMLESISKNVEAMHRRRLRFHSVVAAWQNFARGGLSNFARLLRIVITKPMLRATSFALPLDDPLRRWNGATLNAKSIRGKAKYNRHGMEYVYLLLPDTMTLGSRILLILTPTSVLLPRLGSEKRFQWTLKWTEPQNGIEMLAVYARHVAASGLSREPFVIHTIPLSTLARPPTIGRGDGLYRFDGVHDLLRTVVEWDLVATGVNKLAALERSIADAQHRSLTPTPNSFYYTATAYTFTSARASQPARIYLPPLPGAIVDEVNQADPSLRSKALTHGLSALSAMLTVAFKKAPRVDATFRIVWVWQDGIIWVYRSTVPGDTRLLVPADEVDDRTKWDVLAGFSCTLIEAQAQSASGAQRGVWQGLAAFVAATADGPLYMAKAREWLETQDGRKTMADAQFDGPLKLQTAGGALVTAIREAIYGKKAVAKWQGLEEALALGIL